MRKQMICILSCAALLFTACGNENKAASLQEPVVTEAQQDGENDDTEVDLQKYLTQYSEEDYQNAFDVRKKDPNFAEDETKMYLLPQFDNITLYMPADRYNLILSEGDKKQIFDVPCISPHAILPEFLYTDLDQDGEKEIAVSSLYGTGTGVSVDYFCVLDRDSNGKYVLNEFKDKDYLKQMNEHFSYTYDKDKEQVQYLLDGKNVGKPFSIYCENKKEENEKYTFSGVDMMNFVYFSFDKDKIMLSIVLQGHIDEWAGMDFFENASMEAEVNYQKDGTFTLSNVDLIMD